MKSKIGLMLIVGLMLASLVNCSPAAPLTPEETGLPNSQEKPPAGPIIVAVPTEMGDDPLIQIIPTDAGTGSPDMSATQVLLSLDDESKESVRLAKEDLARRLRVQIDSITVSAVIGQEFSTNAFYCRELKDRIARDDAPAAISGLSILLRVSGHGYEYHAGDGTVIFCWPLG